MNLDHEQISELLGAYTRGELDAQRHEAVRLHLDGCDGCRSEAVGLQALASLPAAELDPSERVALRDAVRGSVRSRSWTARLAPALGALGLVAIAVVGGATLLGEDRPVGGDALQTEAPAAVADEEDSTAAQSAEGAGDTSAAGGGAAGGTVSDEFDKADRDERNAVTGMDIAAPAAQAESLGFAGPSTFYNAAPLGPGLLMDRDIPSRVAANRRLRSIFAVAPSAAWARQIRNCTDVVGDFLPSGARPAYAAVFREDRILVMGFIWSQDNDRHYAFWGWPQNECSVVVPIYQSGTI